MSAILFDRNQVDHLEDLSERPGRLRGSKLPWVDLHDGSEFSADEVAEELDLHDDTRRCLATPNKKACFNDYGRYIHITTYAPHEDEKGELHVLECVVGENWVVTAHDRPIPVLDEFAARVSGSGDTGSLDGPSFLAALLEWVLGAYTAAFEQIEQRLEEFDVQAMRGEGQTKTSNCWSICAARSAVCGVRSPLTAPPWSPLPIRSWRRSAARVRGSGSSRCSAVSRRRCKKPAMPVRRSSAPSTS